MKAIVSCSGKFHAFALAEQLQQRNILAGLYSTYAEQKNRFLRRFAGRSDQENILPRYIHTNIPVAVGLKTFRSEYWCNEAFDRWVAWKISRRRDYDVFVGWSGMSFHAIRAAKRQGKIAILERGSSHILYQNDILKEEYRRFGIGFSIDERVIGKELLEYEACDYISIPSSFVKNSFLEKGIRAEKLLLNPYGTSHHFRVQHNDTPQKVFRILYLGGLTVQKGLIYLFEALHRLSIPQEEWEVWFVGYVSPEINSVIPRYRRSNWTFKGHVDHYALSALISQCDVGVMPSVQDGFGMVIPQMLGCGIPVIATANTGGGDIIREGETGFTVPIRSPEHIAEKIMYLYQNPDCLDVMKAQAAASVREGFTWDDYGARYATFLNSLV